MFFEYKIFSVENILRKGKHFLLFDCVVEITPDNYFLYFFLGCKKSLFSGKCKPKLATTTTKDKHNPPPPTQNPNRFEGKNCHHCSIAITTHKKSTTIHTKPTTTQHKNHQKIQNITTHTTTTIKNQNLSFQPIMEKV